MKRLTVDFDRIVGKIKPVNGVNNGPLTCNFAQDARPYFKEAAFPFARLHDSEYPMGSGEFVDVDCLFKMLSCDENDPASYNFTLTDEYLKAIDETGARMIYRLGATIEHQPVKVHANPPKDSMKWARICEHIIRHYNEGWADGLHLNIEYWEIWNEPELSGHQCWTGTTEEYCKFYKTVVTYLKGKFPQLKFGGPAASWPTSDFVRQFFASLTEDGQRTPLDFFSWHAYLTDPKQAAKLAGEVKDMLAEYGYPEAESVMEEGNVSACAAASEAGKAVMLVNYHDTECKAERVQVKLSGAENVRMKVLRLCGTKNLEPVGEITGEGTLALLPNSVTLLTDRI